VGPHPESNGSGNFGWIRFIVLYPPDPVEKDGEHFLFGTMIILFGHKINLFSNLAGTICKIVRNFSDLKTCLKVLSIEN
jgi:hypothetical protein